MKRLFGLGLALVVLLAAVVVSQNQNSGATATEANKRAAPFDLRAVSADLRVESGEQNPWTNLKLNNAPDEFQFAIISDRTGGHRAQVFARAIERLNLLQPEFVLSVGDLIEGYKEDKAKLEAEWKEFQGFVAKLQMPFFYVAGNHDLANKVETQLWKDHFGRSYYHFVYKNVLFLILNSDDPSEKESGKITPEQADWARKTLDANKDVRWTIVALHKPLWAMKDVEKTGWLDVEKLLAGRKYTVFAGHIHRYQKFVRNGMNYYQLATTGGASKMRGLRYGEFDHFTWITMKKDGPVMANILLDGIFPEDMQVTETDEPGTENKDKRATFPTTGTVYFDGQRVPNAVIALHAYNAKTKKYTRASDGMSECDGTFSLSTYRAFDGAPEGEFKVTVTWREPLYDAAGRPTPNKLPDRYATPEATPLTITIKSPGATADLRLTK